MRDWPEDIARMADDRRFSERVPRRVGCRLYDADGFLIGPGATRNISDGGMLLEVEVDGPAPNVADEIEISLDDGRSLTARIVRCGPFGRGRRLMGVEFSSLPDLVAAA